MNASITIGRDDAKDRVREATDIVDLVGSYLALRRQGKAMVGLCPWHDDSRPSLTVNPERQTFRCWVCNLGGDVFSFMMKMERIEFPEALEMLASRAGIELPKAGRAGPGTSEKAELFRLLDWAAGRFSGALESLPAAEAARQYVAARGLAAEVVRRFAIGFAPNEWDWLVRQASDAGFSMQKLAAAGLAVERQGSAGHYDRFRNRLIFPIRDSAGRCIAFGGRALPGAPADTAKYINSPETPLFSKSSTLYGLDTARDAIARKGRAVVVEGYTDCLAARQAGIDEVVAVLGTALGERHARLLRRYTDRVVLVLDGDDAGRKRADEILDILLAEPIDLAIARLPTGVDPCDLLQADGAAAFQAVIDSACDPLDYRMDEVFSRLQSDRNAGEQAILSGIESVLSALARAGSRRGEGSLSTSQRRLREERMLARLSRRFGLDVAALRDRLDDLRSRSDGRSPRATSTERGASTERGSDPPPATAPSAPLSPWDREVLEVLVGVPESVGMIVREVAVDELESPAVRTVFEAARRLHGEGRPVGLVDLLDALPDPAMQSLLVDADETSSSRGIHDPQERLEHLREAVRRRSALRMAGQHVRQLKGSGLDAESEADLLERLVAQRRVAQGMTDPKDG